MYRLCHTYEWLNDMFIYSKIYATLHVIWSFFTVAYHPSWLCNVFRTTLFHLLTHYICAFLHFRAHLHSVISGLMWLITNNASICYVAYFIKGENFDTWRNTLNDKQLLVKRQIWNLYDKLRTGNIVVYFLQITRYNPLKIGKDEDGSNQWWSRLQYWGTSSVLILKRLYLVIYKTSALIFAVQLKKIVENYYFAKFQADPGMFS